MRQTKSQMCKYKVDGIQQLLDPCYAAGLTHILCRICHLILTSNLHGWFCFTFQIWWWRWGEPWMLQKLSKKRAKMWLISGSEVNKLLLPLANPGQASGAQSGGTDSRRREQRWSLWTANIWVCHPFHHSLGRISIWGFFLFLFMWNFLSKQLSVYSFSSSLLFKNVAQQSEKWVEELKKRKDKISKKTETLDLENL